MNEHPGRTVVRTFRDFDLWLGHAIHGRSRRHQLWLGRPGTGKTARLHRHVRNGVGADLFPGRPGRVEAPIYAGTITPAKWFIRGWQHHLEPLLCFNDVSIRRVDATWEAMLCQFLERPGRRTIRWDLKTRASLAPQDQREITAYLRDRGLHGAFLREQREPDDEYGPAASGPRAGRRFRGSLPEIDDFERAYGADEDDLDGAGSILGWAVEALLLPSAYDTEPRVILMANQLGDGTWQRIHSRLRIFEWDPTPDEMIADLRTWEPAVPAAMLAVIEACHARGEILRLDYRAAEDAVGDFRSGMPCEDALRASFYAPADVAVQEDADAILRWLADVRAQPGQTFTERVLYQDLPAFRGSRNAARRSAALDYPVAQGWIARHLPPAVLRPGQRGRRPGPSFRMQGLPGLRPARNARNARNARDTAFRARVGPCPRPPRPSTGRLPRRMLRPGSATSVVRQGRSRGITASDLPSRPHRQGSLRCPRLRDGPPRLAPAPRGGLDAGKPSRSVGAPGSRRSESDHRRRPLIR
jgi:hypothetical protein